MKRTTTEVTCPNCSKVGTWGMATHIKWCDPYIDVAGFNAKVRRGANDECWPFTGAKVPAGGYGRYTLNYKFQAAHRIAYMLAYGNIAPGLDILHSCDNPPCCNPAHLRAGTAAENAAEMMSKGRHVSASYKLGEEKAREVLALKGKERAVDLAVRMGVSVGSIHGVWTGRTWKRIREAA